MLSLAEGAFRPSAWLAVRSADLPATPDERQRGERTLAIARVCLAVSLFIAAMLDPQGPAPMARGTLLLAAYALFAALALTVLRFRVTHWAAMTAMVHLGDLTATAGVMVLTKAGSPFWFLAVFALVAAARRWGFGETIATAVVVVGLALGPATWPADARALYQLMVGPTLLLLAGILLAYIAQGEKQLRTEAAALAAIVSRVGVRNGLKHTVGVVLDAVVRLVDADRALLVVREVSSGQVSLWEGGRHTGASTPAPRLTPLDSRRFEPFMIAPAASAWYAVRRTQVARAVRYRGAGP